MKHKLVYVEDDSSTHLVEDLLNEGWGVARYMLFESHALLHLEKPDEEDIEATPIAPVIESVIEVPVTTDPEPIRKLTDEGWIVKNLYSKKAQLIKYREEGEENTEEID